MTWLRDSELTTILRDRGGLAGLGEAVNSAELSADALGDLALGAAHEIRALNAFTTLFDPPLIRTDVQRGPLAGAPFVIKDNMALAGVVTTAGCDWLSASDAAAQDAGIVDRLLASGAQIIGRGNMPELSSSALSANAHFGSVGHPLDGGRSPGGSSSGTAVAIAAGAAVGGLGTDTGGSVVLPAALTGLFGYRPTTGRFSTRGVTAFSPSFDTVGFMARSAEDLLTIFAALDSTTKPAGSQPLSDTVFGVVGSWAGRESDAEVLWAFECFCASLRANGASVHDCALTAGASVFADIRTIAWAEAAVSWAPLVDKARKPVSAEILRRVAEGGSTSRDDYRRALQDREAWVEEVDRAFAGVDFLLAPTTPIVAPLIDADPAGVGSLVTRFTYPFCFAGVPLVTVPISSRSTFPIGALLIGRRGSDRDLIQLAVALSSSAAL